MSSSPIIEVRQPDKQSLFVLVRSAIIAGREGDGLVIADPQVSRRHLELRPHGGRVICTDLASRNGSMIDGEPCTEPVLLEHGMTMTIGDTTIRLFESERPVGVEPGRQTTIVGLGWDAASDGADGRMTSIDAVADDVARSQWSPTLEGETVTILFSDIESSTERASALGDAAWFEVLDGHNLLMREELARSSGYEVKTQGDGFMITFSSVRRALRFAIAVQRRLPSLGDDPLRVRMGLHTGEAIYDTTGDLFGRHVNKAARVAGLASGGQVLASATVREIAQGADEFRFAEGVGVELKGLSGTHVVHAVELESD